MRNDSAVIAEKPAPAFASAEECRKWIANLPLANAAQAQADLLSQCARLGLGTAGVEDRLHILELLREPIHFVMTETARKFIGRPLPFGHGEQAAFDANRMLAHAIADGYQGCLDACVQQDEEASRHAGLIAERTLAAYAREQFEHYRAGMELAAGFWSGLHDAYAKAERLGVAHARIEDRYFASRPVSPSSVFGFVLAMHTASPYELSPRQLQNVKHWLANWSRRLEAAEAPVSNPRLPSLVADLALDSPPVWTAPPAGDLRYIDTVPMASRIKKRLRALADGATAESLGLGADCGNSGCEQLLRHLYDHCCKGGVPRAQARRPVSGECRFVIGTEGIHYYLSGRKPFRQPSAGRDLSRHETDTIATLGIVADHTEKDFSRRQGFRIESWRMADETPAGLRMVRSPAADGGRLARGQLVALTTSDERGYVLAVARWVILRRDGSVETGVRLIPGKAKPVALRPHGSAYARDAWRPGFLLGEVRSLEAAPKIVVPPAWFKTGRLIDVFDEEVRRVRLTALAERGMDFERGEFELE